MLNNAQLHRVTLFVVSISLGVWVCGSRATAHVSLRPLLTNELDAGEVGMAFFDPKTHEAIALVEEGRNAEAIKLLEEGLAEKGDKGKKRRAELQLGLAMVLIRSAEWSKSSERLNTLVKNTDDPTIPYRAVALQAARAYALADKEGAKERLSTRSGWQMALLGAKVELWKQLEKSVAQLEKLVNSKSWDSSAGQLEHALTRLRALACCNITKDDLVSEADRRVSPDVRSLKEMTEEFSRVLDRVGDACVDHCRDCDSNIKTQRERIRDLEQEKIRCRTDTCRKAKESAIRGHEAAIRDEEARILDIRRWQDRFRDAKSQLDAEVGRASSREGR